jgi:type I restriction enzyme, S subunit
MESWKRGVVDSWGLSDLMLTAMGLEIDSDSVSPENHVFRARIHEPRLEPYFLSWTANSLGGRWAERNGKQSVNLASISLSMIRKMPVIVPASGEAGRALASPTESLEATAQLEASIAAAGVRGRALRRSLLATAFTGRLAGKSTDCDLVEEMALA